jgi:hypothetical protein
MDTIRFYIRDTTEEIFQGKGDHREVAISVNDRDLVEILTEVEMPYAVAKGIPSIAGGYLGLPPEDVVLPSQHFLGEPTWAVYKDVERVSVLECNSCRFPGCWPFMVKITVEEDRVIWSDFEQPHRRPTGEENDWTYEQLKPFVFDRGQYMSALKSLSAACLTNPNDE